MIPIQQETIESLDALLSGLKSGKAEAVRITATRESYDTGLAETKRMDTAEYEIRVIIHEDKP